MFWGMILTNVPELMGFTAALGLVGFTCTKWGRYRERKRLTKLNPGLSV